MLLVLWLVLWLALTWTNLILVLIASLGCQSPGCTHAYADWGCLVVGVQCNMEERGRAPLPPRSCHVKVLCRREQGLILKTLFSCLKASHRFKSQEDGSAMIKNLLWIVRTQRIEDDTDFDEWDCQYWLCPFVLIEEAVVVSSRSCGSKKKRNFLHSDFEKCLKCLKVPKPWSLLWGILQPLNTLCSFYVWIQSLG